MALKSLEQELSGKVKCIYIDPPFNTGQAFEHYDDGIEYSIWLSLMRDRLDILKRLLNLTVKKIPRAVLARCEWGHDDYSLRVENLPQAPPPEGQMGLFSEEPD